MARGLVRIAAAAAALLLASGCGGDSPPTEAGPAAPDPQETTSAAPATTAGSTTDGPAEESFTDPPAEETGRVETPVTPPPESVSLDLAGLPIGGSAELVSDLERCVFVNWSAPPDIPLGVSVRVTAAALQPADSFVLADDICQVGAPCLAADQLLQQVVQCVVGVRQVAPTADGLGSLQFTRGVVTCPPGREADCTAFAAEVEALGPDVIEWSDAQTSLPDEGSTDEGTSEDENPPADDTSDQTGAP